jgi:serine/threonine-protein kinase
MGEVYEVRDLLLHATVAMKTVHEHADVSIVERLRREVQLARSVTHPNVCRVFDLHEATGPDGSPLVFITMEFLDGKTLSERIRSRPLTAAEALPLLEQMANGLAAIHRQGLVHRDFKPGNVILVADRTAVRAVVTDFGIARLTSRGAETGWAATAEGAVIGSPAYMAPEQRRGGETTPATDVHALALVACEMVSGEVPENGVLQGVPARWQAPLKRGLHPDPGQRPSDPRVLVKQLGTASRSVLPRRAGGALLLLLAAFVGLAAWRIRTSSQAQTLDRRSIAVLPLANLGTSAEDAYFGRGLAEDILTQLSRIRGLHVIYSPRDPKDGAVGLRDAQKLGVRTVLEGSVRRAGNRVRITAQLVDAANSEQLWAETYDRDVQNVLDVQTDVASKVAAALALRLSEDEKRLLQRGGTTNPEAYDAYLRGLARAQSAWEPQAALGALSDFERAVRLDPGFASAHARLGLAYLELGLWADADTPGWLPRAKVELDRAMALEPGLALLHLAQSQLLGSRQGGLEHGRGTPGDAARRGARSGRESSAPEQTSGSPRTGTGNPGSRTRLPPGPEQSASSGASRGRTESHGALERVRRARLGAPDWERLGRPPRLASTRSGRRGSRPPGPMTSSFH